MVGRHWRGVGSNPTLAWCCLDGEPRVRVPTPYQLFMEKTLRRKEPKDDKQRIIKRFLFFPRTIQGETRWLEFAQIGQKYTRFQSGHGYWRDVAWVNE